MVKLKSAQILGFPRLFRIFKKPLPIHRRRRGGDRARETAQTFLRLAWETNGDVHDKSR